MIVIYSSFFITLLSKRLDNFLKMDYIISGKFKKGGEENDNNKMESIGKFNELNR